MFVDSHCHIDFPEFLDQFEKILCEMDAHSVSAALCVCVTLEDFLRVLSVANKDARLHASLGVHPDYQDVTEPGMQDLLDLASKNPKVVAIGETGLDYFRRTPEQAPVCSDFSDFEWQRDRFRTHIRAARQTKKPLIIHTRAAASDTIRIMQEEGADHIGGVMHCFTEDWSVAKQALDLGFHISFSGILTFKNAESVRDVAKKVPDDRLLIETDSPYLAPVPFRGKVNQPAWVRYVADCMAKLRGESLQKIGEMTTKNYHDLFRC